MAITKIKLKQLENSVSAPGSITATDSSNILTYVAPSSGVNHLWGFETGGAGTLPILIGTNLSYDAGTNTLNASAGAGGYSEIQEEGGALTARSKINFIGSGITAADDAGNSRTNVTLNSFLNTLATAGTILLSSGNVSGTLAVANGGTGATTLTGLLQGNGTGAVTAITNSSTVGQILRVTGASTYAWGALDLSSTNAVANTLAATNGGTGQASYAIGDILYASTTTALSKLADVATGNALISGGVGVAPSYGKIGLTTHVSGTLPIANGGTGSATQNFVDLTTGQSIGGAKTFTSNITISATPSANTDAATVGWVLNNVAGLKSGSVRVATTAILTATAQTATTITLGGTTLTIDGQTMANGETVLVKDSVTGGSGGTFNNGVYTVGGIGSSVVLTRVPWMDTAGEIDGIYVLVQDGSANVGTLWFTVSEVNTLGTDAISFTQIQTSGTIGGSAAANKVAYGSGANTLTSTTLFHFDGTKLGIGTATPVANNLLTTKGTTSDNTAFGYSHLNSGDTQVFRVSNNGTVQIGSGAPVTLDSNGLTSTGTLFVIGGSSGSIRLYSGSATSLGSSLSVEASATKTHTSGDWAMQQLVSGFAPTSGTGTYKSLWVNDTINQTGGANGITRGIYINPTLTAAANYRALEITANSSHYAIYSTAGKIRFDFGTPAVGDILTRDTGGEEVRIAAGTAGYVLTSNGAGTKPTWQAAAASVTVTRAYRTGFSGSTLTLNSGTDVTDIDGTNVAFSTSGLTANQIVVVRNGIVLSQSGTVSRDYTLNTSTSVLVFADSVATDENIMVYKIV